MANISSMLGNPEESYGLFEDLLKAFSDSKLFKNCGHNKALVFDIIMAIGQFSATIFKELDAACLKSESNKVSICDLYLDSLKVLMQGPNTFDELIQGMHKNKQEN